MTYVDGIVVAVPTAKKAEYVARCREAAAAFKRHGALQTMENWGDNVPEGDVTSFPKAVQCKPDETVVFSWILWPSKAARDAGMPKALEEMEMDLEGNPFPFDGKRMIFGGFETILEA